MSVWTDKKILLGVTGGIAAFKSASLCSFFVGQGADVEVVMTRGAAQFVSPITFRGLTGKDVSIETFEERYPGKIAHIHLADSSDLIMVAPATAHFIAKHANGLADDMLSNILLATENRQKVLVCPAMNVHMYQHPATQRNVETLRSFGIHILEPAVGRLACGYDDIGKLPATEIIIEKAKEIIEKKAH